MGHLQSLTLPKSRKWREVVALIEGGAPAAEVARRAALAAESALARAAADPVFLASARILVELPLAARNPGFERYQKRPGIPASCLDSQTRFLSALAQALEKAPAATDLGEMARTSLLRAVAAEFERRLPSLFPPNAEDIRSALVRLTCGPDFTGFARSFFAGLVYRSLAYYLSRELATHTGGSVARIVRDSLRDSMVLVAGHERTCASDLPHDELALLRRRPDAARLAADPG